MAPGVAGWPLALPDGHWRCRMAGRCRLTRGVAVYPRALPWGVAACHRALPYASWRCRVVSGVAGIPKIFTLKFHMKSPGTRTRRVATHCDVQVFDISVMLHEWSNLTFRSKIQSRFCRHSHKLQQALSRIFRQTCAMQFRDSAVTLFVDFAHAVLFGL